MSHCIAVENLRAKYPGDSHLLFSGFSLRIPQGQKVLILGPNGSGKSTLLLVLCGLIPDSVEIPIRHSGLQKPESWGIVFQDPDTQFCMAYADEELAFVLENLQVPRQEMEGRMRQALALVGLEADELHVPIAQMSLGMKQRLALAAMLLLKPQTVFLDEPSAFLDDEGTKQVWQSIKGALTRHTVVVVEHKLDAVIDWIDRIVLLDERGGLLADGEPEVVLRRHKADFDRYGIWHPTVWQEYAASRERAAGAAVSGPAPGADAPAQAGRPVIELENFRGYRGKTCKIAVDRATVAEKSWIAVTGKNGSGKTTLLLALMQLIDTTGTYRLQGRPVSSGRKKRAVPDGVSLVFQNPEMQFISNSIFDELAYPWQREGRPPEQIQALVQPLLQQFHLAFQPDRHPYQLSMGQKRRLSVATALLSGAPVLLLDEPTFGQDARNTFLILEQLEQLRKQGKTLIMVTHDRRIVEHFATEEWVIERGTLKEIRSLRPHG